MAGGHIRLLDWSFPLDAAGTAAAAGASKSPLLSAKRPWGDPLGTRRLIACICRNPRLVRSDIG